MSRPLRKLSTLIVMSACAALPPVDCGAAPAHPEGGAMRLEGRLVTPDGEPLGSGTVQLFDATAGGEERPVATTAPDRLGRFAVVAPRLGLWVIRVGAPGRAEREVLVEPVEDVVSLPPAALPRTTSIALRIVDADRRPVAARVGVRPKLDPEAVWQPVPVVTRAGARGRASIPTEEPAGGRTLRLAVQAPGLPPAEHEIVVEDVSGEEVVIALRPGVDRWIRLIDGTGRPAAAVEIHAANGDCRGLPPLAVTDDDGRAALTVPPNRPLAITLRSPGGYRSAATLGPPESPEGAASVTLRLPPPGWARGRVVQAGTGRPLPGALVWSRPGDGSVPRPIPAAWTDAGGEFELTLAPRYRDNEAADADRRGPDAHAGESPSAFVEPVLAAVAVGHYAVEIGLDRSARASGIALPLPPLRLAVGTVVDREARPVAGARVSLSGPAVVSDERGRFGVPNPAPGRHDLEVRASGFAPLRMPGIELAPGRGEQSLGELVLPPGSGLEGYVVDPDGEPVAGVQVLAIEAGVGPPEVELLMAARPSSARGDAAGRFRFDDLEAGAHWLVARKGGFLDSEVTAVEVPADGILEVVLRPAASISGWVLDPDGQGVAHALVTVERDDPAGGSGAALAPGRHATTAEDGRFEISGAPAGRLTLTARAGGFRDRRLDGLELGPGEELPDLEIRLLPGASLAGTVWDLAGAPAADVLVGIEPADGSRARASFTRSDGDGRFRLGGLDPGAWRLTAESAGGLRARAAAQTAGAETLVDLHLERGAAVAGRVRDRDGRPLATVRVVLLGSDTHSNGHQTVTDAAGAFTFAGVADGAYQLTASSDAHLPSAAAVEVAGAPVSGLELELSPGATLQGRLLGVLSDELSRAIVSAPRVPGASTRLDYAGRFSLAGLPPGELLVEIRLPGRPPLTRRVTLPEGMPEVSVQILMGADGEAP